ncbi:peptidylprolyl isomerase [Palleronia rufa]|uniref:peptidylprolyl isomerase n=1 Tax=Palleronia rufa TaxID=1530186 RepID=UPI000566209E|nr:peptidylprolyl isomerase [Palleronia rufa]
MTKLRTLTAAAALVLALPAAAQDASTVVATVDGTDITLGHMIAMRERLPEQYQSLDDQTLFDGILEQLEQQTALSTKADGLSPEGELVMENERRALLAAEVVEARAAEAVTEEDVQAAYEEAYGNAEPATEYNASHILVETEEEARSLIAELEDGADFAELAKANSTGPSGPSGGDLGWFLPDAMVAEFADAVQEMEPGAISEPVQTQFGWHVIKLNDTRETTPPPLDEVRGEIEGQLQLDAIETIVSDAMDGAEITRPETQIDPALLRDTSLLD